MRDTQNRVTEGRDASGIGGHRTSMYGGEKIGLGVAQGRLSIGRRM